MIQNIIFRIFQGIFQGQRKSRVCQGLTGFPGFVGHPVKSSEAKCMFF